MLKPLAAATAFAALLAAGPAQAGAAGDITREALYSGNLAQGAEALAPLRAADDPEAAFGQGMIDFVLAIEGFAQDLYRHGLAAPETGPMGPALAVPLPPNPHPEPLDYPKVRAMLEKLVTQLDIAGASFEAGGKAGDYVVLLDPLKIRIDANGDGKREEGESIERIFAGAGHGQSRSQPADDATARAGAGQEGQGRQVRFSYRRVGAGCARERYDHRLRSRRFHLACRLQPDLRGAGRFLPLVRFRGFRQRRVPSLLSPRRPADAGLRHQWHAGARPDDRHRTPTRSPRSTPSTGRWSSPSDLAGAAAPAKITTLSRANWDAIPAETDDNRELVPSPNQTSLVPDAKVTDEVVAAWRETLDVADKVLAGELLVPHWRFNRGRLNAWFNAPNASDLVMLLDGYDALPYSGLIASAESFAAANRFGDQWMGYVFWFN